MGLQQGVVRRGGGEAFFSPPSRSQPLSEPAPDCELRECPSVVVSLGGTRWLVWLVLIISLSQAT